MLSSGAEETGNCGCPALGPRIGFQGVPGAYSEEALLAFMPEAQAVPYRTLADLFAALSSGEIAHAFVPVENSHAGSVVEAYDLMLAHAVTVSAEWTHPVRHLLLGAPGATLESVVRVYSHPQALAQTSAFLQSHGLSQEPYYDTAGAAKMVAEEADSTQAAVAGQQAARRYGLEVLACGIETSADNATRFFLLAAGGWSAGRTTHGAAGKTSLVFGVEHQPGTLARALQCFSEAGVNLSRLESRPSRQRPWEYLFFADLQGSEDEPPVREALERLRQVTTQIRILGSYPGAE